MAKSLTERMAGRLQSLVILAVIGAAAVGAWAFLTKASGRATGEQTEISRQGRGSQDAFTLAAAQWSTLSTEAVATRVFRDEQVTEGKIAVDEDRSTPVFSPYSGRVIRLPAKPGDSVTRGQLLFTIEATDMVQAQNDFISGIAARNKARSQLSFAEIDERRFRTLSKDKAVPQRDFEQAQTALVAAQNDLRAAETALEAVRNRLRILGKSDDEIATYEKTGKISAETTIHSPLAGTIVQRKVGPGQYVATGASDPVFVIGDLSSVWLVAYVRETEAPKIKTDQQIEFTVLAYPDQVFRGNIRYIAATLDPNTRRLLIRTTMANGDGLLKPEMFCNVRIFVDEGDLAAAVPREAVIYEGSSAHVWVADQDRVIELRPIKVGITEGGMVQVLEGLRPGERVVTKGSLFIDRAAVGT